MIICAVSDDFMQKLFYFTVAMCGSGFDFTFLSSITQRIIEFFAKRTQISLYIYSGSMFTLDSYLTLNTDEPLATTQRR